jgi:hypothetical protein
MTTIATGPNRKLVVVSAGATSVAVVVVRVALLPVVMSVPVVVGAAVEGELADPVGFDGCCVVALASGVLGAWAETLGSVVGVLVF